MLGFLGFFRLFESIFYCSNRDAVIQIVSDLHFTSSHIRVIQFGSGLVFVSLHSIGFSRASLSVCEHSCVETINNFRDQTWDLKLLKNFLLRVVIINNFIKTVALFRVVFVLENGDFILIGIYFHHVGFMVFFYLLADQWPNPNSNSYI